MCLQICAAASFTETYSATPATQATKGECASTEGERRGRRKQKIALSLSLFLATDWMRGSGGEGRAKKASPNGLRSHAGTGIVSATSRQKLPFFASGSPAHGGSRAA